MGLKWKVKKKEFYKYLMARYTRAGIDIGTHSVKVVIAEEVQDAGRVVPKVIGSGVAETNGLSKGFIVNAAEVSHAVRAAVDKAERASGVEIKRAFVSVGGVGLSSVISTGSVAVSRADLEVTSLDVESAYHAAETSIPPAQFLNRKIINTIPLETKLDGKPVIGRVEGMRGSKLEIKILFITCLEHHIEDLIRSVEGAGVEVIDVVAAPIAASFVTLSKKQKRAGCVLVNIGAETTSLVVFENTNPLSLEVFDVGGVDLTNDIALGLKISLDEAESIKLGSLSRTDYPKKKIDDIISSRLGDIFDLIDGHLKKIGRQGLLPAGVVLTGGTASIYGVKDFAADTLKLPSRIGEIHFGTEEKRSNKDMPWAVAYGLVVVAFNAENEQGSVGQKGMEKIAEGSKKSLRTISSWINKFLP